MSKKLTDWFPADLKPVRAGVYETGATEAHPCYQYWDGDKWSAYCDSVARAYKFNNFSSRYQRVMWRGLAKKP